MRRRNDNQSAGLGLNVGLIGGIVSKFSFLAWNYLGNVRGLTVSSYAYGVASTNRRGVFLPRAQLTRAAPLPLAPSCIASTSL